MSSHFGEANRAAFRAQVIDLDAGTTVKPNPPLDPEEAATIARTHLKSLAPVGTPGASYREPVLIVAPPSTGAGAAPPPPEHPR
ncbi:hypothetical protein [Pendulispora albinea]|uniref:Uncharacterized protein n=1 Tax=Pendulispora albinea TaxID=2741071 RepID=A0ABZ2LSI2_9BACT